MNEGEDGFGCDLSSGWPSIARETGWYAFPHLVFSDIMAKTHVVGIRDWRPTVQVASLQRIGKDGQKVRFRHKIGMELPHGVVVLNAEKKM